MKKNMFFMVVAVLSFAICFQCAYALDWDVVDTNSVDKIDGYKIGNYYFKLNDDYDENYKRGLEYSSDGKNFIQHISVRTNSYPRYNNGLYFVVDNSNETVPINKRYVGFENSPAYILDDDLNIIKTIDDKCYIQYLGYFGGYHYIDFTYYVSNDSKNAWESVEVGHLYKTIDGREMISVNYETEDVSFLRGTNLYDGSIIKTGYDRADNLITEIYLPNNKYSIHREQEEFVGYSYVNNFIPLLSLSYKIGEESVRGYDDRIMVQSVEKKYLTMDGVYGVEMPDDIGRYCFEMNGNYYFEKDEEHYYCIPVSELKDKIKVVYDNKILAFATPPTTESDRTLVPMRFLFEQMGANVDWNNETQTATVEKQNEVVAFSINNTVATVNSIAKTMDVPARLINDKTMIPLRFLSEELGYNVEWDENTKTVTITE